MTVQITDVPQEKVVEVVRGFLSDPDSMQVIITRQANGLWTIEKKDTDDQGSG